MTNPEGNGAITGKSDFSGTFSSRIAADTAFASDKPDRQYPFFAAQASTEKRPLISVAVVITGVAPNFLASFSARIFIN